MKIVKGVFIYTLIIIGILLVVAALLIGCMFLVPKFTLFGYGLLSNNHVVNKAIEPFDIKDGGYYCIEVDANLYDVEFTLRNDDIKSIFIQKTDDMFALYKPKQNGDNPLQIDPKKSDTLTLDKISGKYYETIKIIVPTLKDSVITIPRTSKIHVALPNNASYRIKTTTTEGDVNITGKSLEKTFPLVALNVTTKSGNLDINYVTSSLYQREKVATTTRKYIKSTGKQHGEAKVVEVFGSYGKVTKYAQTVNVPTSTDTIKETIDGKEVDVEVKTSVQKTYNYKRMYNLSELNLSTDTGVFNFEGVINNGDDCSIVTGKDLATVDEGLSTFEEKDFNARIGNVVKNQTVNLHAERGTFKFASLYTGELLVSGKDIMVTGKTILTKNNFYFNAPNGFFTITELISPISTIITNNININLGEIGGALSVTTTYGNIKVGTVKKNTSLESVHGNITVDKAMDSISCESEYGDIKVKEYNARAYFKNNHGVTDVTFKAPEKALTGADYKQACDIITGDGSVYARKLRYETNITSLNGGRVDAEFDEMYEADENNPDANDYRVNHSVTINGGSSIISIPRIAPFLFFGNDNNKKGKINGAIGSVAMAPTADYEVKLAFSDESGTRINRIAKLLANVKGGTISFSTNSLTD